jgi:Na+-driven multidrug efflux pump
MVGQHLGAGDPRMAMRSAHATMRLAAVPMLGLGLFVFVTARPGMALFSPDPAIVDAGVVYLRVQCFVFLFMAAESVYEGAFSGSGDTVPAFWITTIGTWGRLPVAWLLAYPAGMGIVGVWVAIAGSTCLKGIAMGMWFRRGRWAEQGG